MHYRDSIARNFHNLFLDSAIESLQISIVDVRKWIPLVTLVFFKLCFYFLIIPRNSTLLQVYVYSVAELYTTQRNSEELWGTLWNVAHQAPVPMEFSRQEYWSELPFPDPGTVPISLVSCISGRFFTTSATYMVRA